MNEAVQSWMRYLQSSGVLAGAPLLLGGLVLLLGGWRLWRFAVAFSFALIGAAVATKLCHDPAWRIVYALTGAVLVGAASWWPALYAAAVLGGLIGSGLTVYFIEPIGIQPWTQLASAAGAFIVFTALSAIDMRQLVIIITAFEGAMLVLSAGIALGSAFPPVLGYFKQMSRESMIFLPFIVAVPTVVGVLLQMADVNRRNASIA